MQKFISIFLTSLLMVNGINNEALSQTNDEEFSETKNRVEANDYKVGDFELYNGEEIIDEYRYSAKLLNGSNDYIILHDKVWQTKSGSMGNVSVSSNDDWFGSSKKSLDKYVIPLEGHSVFKYAIMINGVTDLVMMKGDVLDGFETIKVCTAYTKDGETVTEMPYDTEGWQPVYEELPGWHTPLTELRAEADFPQAFKDYIAYIEKATATPITIVSVGPDREATIIR